MKNFLIWLVLLTGLAYGGAKWYMHNEVSKGMDMAILMMSPYADVEYDGVASTLTGELTVENVRVRVNGYNDTVVIDSVGIDTPSFLALMQLGDVAKLQSRELPEYFGFIINGLRMQVDADYFEDLYEFALMARGIDGGISAGEECTGKYGFSPDTLSALGYRDQVISATSTIHDHDSRWSLEFDVSVEDMWEMQATVDLAGNMIAGIMSGKDYQPRLQKMYIEFTDLSLNDRVSRYCQRRGLSEVDTLKAQIESFKFVGEEYGIVFDQYMTDPYKEFLLGKPTLVITAQPSNPVAFSQIDLYKPEDVPALLNLAAVAR